eukprot:SM000299S10849  [mRNA]  locus=s299:69480:71846:- [translate_table: standard]
MERSRDEATGDGGGHLGPATQTRPPVNGLAGKPLNEIQPAAAESPVYIHRQGREFIPHRLNAIGLDIRADKCSAWSPQGLPAHLRLPEGCQTPAGGLTLLGVPLGAPAFVTEQLQARLQEHLRPADRLHTLHDMQLAAAMLTRCIAQRPQYLARTIPPSSAVKAAYAAFDSGILASAATLVQHPAFLTTPAALLQASLPISRGGLGCRSVARGCEAAYMGSWAQVAAPMSQRFLVHGQRALERVAAEVDIGQLPFQVALRSARDGLLAVHPRMSEQAVPFIHLAHTPDQRAQARFSALVEQAASDQVVELLPPADLRGRARLLSASSPGAAAWL